MPVIPVYQRNQVAPTNLPSVRVNTQADPSAFGMDVARGLGHVAQAVGEIAEREREKQDLAAIMAAERELQQWQNQALFDPDTGAFSQKGQAAFDLPDRLLPEWDKRVGAIEARLNGRQRALLRERAGNMRVQMERDLLRHVGGEAEKYRITETEALAQQRIETALLYATNPERFEQELREAQGVLLAGYEGQLPPSAMNLRLLDVESKARSKAIQRLIETDPMQAQRQFDTWRDRLTAADASETERLLRPALVLAQAEDWVARAEALQAGAAPEVAGDAPRSPQDVQTLFRELAKKHGATITSMVRPVIARGAGARSQHPKGTAADFRTKDLPPERVESLIRDLRAAGFEVIDERNTDQPHIHAELPPGVAPARQSAGQPASKADVLAFLNGIPDRDVRREALSLYRTRLEIASLREAERDEAMLESIRRKVESAAPGTPLARILSPQEHARAAEKGWLGGFEERMNQRLRGTEPKTDPVVFDAIHTTLARAASGDPVALGEVRKMDVTRLFGVLDTQAREFVMGRRAAILGAGKEVPEIATEDKLLSLEVWGRLGIGGEGDEDKVVTDPLLLQGVADQNRDQAITGADLKLQFMRIYLTEKDARQREKGRPLNSSEQRALMQELVQPFARSVRERTWYGGESKRDEAMLLFALPPPPEGELQRMRDAYQRVRGVPLSREEAIRIYHARVGGWSPNKPGGKS